MAASSGFVPARSPAHAGVERGGPHGQPIWIGGRAALGDGSEPAAGARVSLRLEEPRDRRDRRLIEGEPAPDPVARTRSDPRGWFRLQAPGPGPWTLRVELAGHVPMEHRILPVPDEQELAPVRLRRARTERLRMVDPAGEPAIDSWVELRSSSLDAPGGGWRRAGWAGWIDERGLLELPRAEGEQVILELGNAWGRERVAIGPTPRDAQVVHEPWGEVALLSVRVEDHVGTPMAEALLRVDGIPWTLTGADGVGVLPAPAGVAVEAIAPSGERGELATGTLDPAWLGDGDVAGEPELHPVTIVLEPSVLEPAVLEPPAVAPSALDPSVLKPSALDPSVLEPARSLRFRVRSRDGSPIVGGWVLVAGSWSRTGSAGELELPVGATGEGAAIEIGAVGHRWRPFAAARATTADPTEVILEPTAIAEGFVIDAAGRALPGAELVAIPASRRAEQAPASAWARSRDDGSFRLRGLEPRTLYELVASHPDLPTARERFGAPAPRAARSDLRIVLRAPRRVSGVVLDGDAGTPIEGAQVWIEGLEDRARAERAVVTGADGAFAWDDVPDAARFDVRVAAEGFAPGAVLGVETPIDQPGDVDLGAVVLERGAGLDVVVRDADGLLLEGASVAVDAGAPLRPPGPIPPRGERLSERWDWQRTDEHGEARFGGLARERRVTVYVAHADHVSFEVDGIAVPRELPLEVRLRGSAAVWGTVEDEEGRPLERVFVAVFPSGPMLLSPDDLVTRTDDEGRYAVSGVPAGRHRVEARPVGHAEIEPVELEAVAGERHRVDFRVPPSALVEGRVIDARGAPLEGATVVAAGRLAHTDERGEFRLDRVRLGERLFEVRDRDHGTVTRRVTVAGDLWLDFELGSGAGVIGRVLSVEGEPLEGVDLHLQGLGIRRLMSRTTGADGRFAFTDVEPGTYRLEVRDPRLVPVEGPLEVVVREESISELDVRVLFGEATLRGRVTGMPPLTEAPDGVRVSVWSERARRYAEVDDDGSFVIEGLVPGRWTVRAYSIRVGYSRDPRPLPPVYEGFAEVVVEPGDREMLVEVALERDDPERVRFAGRVTVDGVPPVGTHLLLTSVDGRGQGGSPSLNALGEFEHTRVGAGIYELTVGALDTTLTRLATLDLRADLHLDLDLFRMTTTGAVVDGANGAPIEGAEVFVVVEGGPYPGQDERTSVVSGRDGAFQVVALVPSAARLLIRRTGYQTAEVEVGPGAWNGLYVRLTPIAAP